MKTFNEWIDEQAEIVNKIFKKRNKNSFQKFMEDNIRTYPIILFLISDEDLNEDSDINGMTAKDLVKNIEVVLSLDTAERDLAIAFIKQEYPKGYKQILGDYIYDFWRLYGQ